MRFVIAAFFILLLILTGLFGPLLIAIAWVILIILGIVILYWIFRKIFEFLAALWMATVGRLFSMTVGRLFRMMAKFLEKQFGETGAECIAAVVIVLTPFTILLITDTEWMHELVNYFLHF